MSGICGLVPQPVLCSLRKSVLMTTLIQCTPCDLTAVMMFYVVGVLKAWIEPMPDGTLPNTKIRSSVLKLLGLLPVDCSFEDRKAQLKRSGLGRAVLFLAKVPGTPN